MHLLLRTVFFQGEVEACLYLEALLGAVDSSSLFCFLLQFISGILAALSAMISLEIPQVNIMTKMDLLSKKAKKEIEK